MKKSVKHRNNGYCMILYHMPGPSAVVSYIFEYPRTSRRKHGAVKSAIIGRDLLVVAISRRIWFLRYLG